ncbi:hypothetical protein [Streptomyces lunalinharesii]|uniref:Uncharacterized protein n=1 Tax=Streptomyces lunalinharesii TaxID=333384 RepID=A0ABN3SXH4_9ACTN
MGDIAINRAALDRLLRHAGSRATTYQQAFDALAHSHKGRPAADIVPLLRQAADEALLGFRHQDFVDQAEAISRGAPYELRITVT